MRKAAKALSVIMLAAVLLSLFVCGCTEEKDKKSATESIEQESLISFPGRTVGLLIDSDMAYEGYTLFAPMRSTTTYLIDNSGEVVHTWESEYYPGDAVYLLENGNILRAANPGQQAGQTFGAGGAGGIIQEITWDGTVVWEFKYSGDQYRAHHDIEPMPNGNVLVIAWEFKTAEEAVMAGRDPALLAVGALWPDHIVEVQPTEDGGGTIVWEWHVWDHLIQDYDPTKDNFGNIAEHPELIDINYSSESPNPKSADFTHINSVDYNQELDQVLLSIPRYFEIWVVDHSTTTEEAAGHSGGNSGKGGDLLYRWGNPRAYDAGDAEDQKFFSQHYANWISSGLPGEGDILLFNNNHRGPDGLYSSVDEITPAVNEDGTYYLEAGSAYGPAEQTWKYMADPPSDFYSRNISGAQRLPNGNTLICSGANGTFFEVTPQGEVIWEYVNPYVEDGELMQGKPVPESQKGSINCVFTALRYAPDYAGLAGRI
jgi:hypothetical protein